jgi:hypothetical protein
MDGDFPMFGAAKTPNIGNLEVIFVKEPRKEEYRGGGRKGFVPLFSLSFVFPFVPLFPLA